ncbi:hypothetical protein EB796_010948 [Bugula neritina]|uniref:Ig-like domain-containing protein n=1 Tax=Bugula neritina TaxID=10212 RepID=A0A7J7JWE4_BUGNE|nr:hypothetical protein EB796_010948 [Bugula neritina]
MLSLLSIQCDFRNIDVKSEVENPNRMQVISGVELDCDIHVIGNPKPTMFFWVREGVTQLEETDHRLNLTPKTADTNETVMCTAGNSIGKHVTVTWHIEWQSDSKTSSNDAKTNYQSNLMTRCSLSFIIFSVIWKYFLP